MQSIDPTNFPNLKYLEIPINWIYDFDSTKGQESSKFQDLQIKYHIMYEFSEAFNLRSNGRYAYKLKNRQETEANSNSILLLF